MANPLPGLFERPMCCAPWLATTMDAVHKLMRINLLLSMNLLLETNMLLMVTPTRHLHRSCVTHSSLSNTCS